MAYKSNLKAIDKWQAKNVDRIVIKPRKHERFSERIQIAVDRGLARSRQDYIIQAVKKALAADEIPEIENED